MNMYSIVFNTMCIYFMVTTASAAKASRRPSLFIAACFLFVLVGNAALLDFEIAEAAMRGAAVAAVFVLLYWVLIRSASRDQ